MYQLLVGIECGDCGHDRRTGGTLMVLYGMRLVEIPPAGCLFVGSLTLALYLLGLGDRLYTASSGLSSGVFL